MFKLKVITLKINILTLENVLNQILQFAFSLKSSYVCVANVHMSIEAYRDEDFKKLVNNADLVIPDGMPLSRAIKMLYGIKQDRIAGMDLLPRLLIEAEKNDLGVFFYGGTLEMLELTKKYVQVNYPKIVKHYYYNPPFRNLDTDEENIIINLINDKKVNLVFVVLGCPKQEKWMAYMKGKINACMIGIGGALPVLVGIQKRAPKWMQQTSLEWFFRFMQEPKRLFKRYLITNSYFIILFSKQFILKKRHSKGEY